MYNPEEIGTVKLVAFGSRLVIGVFGYRYARAGGFLKADHPAYSNFGIELRRDANGIFVMGQEETDALWGDLRPEGEKHLLIGWPVVDVAPGQYFWLREKGI